MKKSMMIMLLALVVLVTNQATAQCGCYKEYVAVLNQYGQNAPTANVLKNNTGMNIQWVYDAPGEYYASGIVADTNNVVVIGGDLENYYSVVSTYWNGEIVTVSTAQLGTWYDPMMTDDTLHNWPIMIRIYQ